MQASPPRLVEILKQIYKCKFTSVNPTAVKLQYPIAKTSNSASLWRAHPAPDCRKSTN
jgi:hypothetical protein